MKIRSLLTVVAMLSVLLFGIGTAHAVLGVDDNVPGQDIAFPIICSAPTPYPAGATAGVDTAWAIADVAGTGSLFNVGGVVNYTSALHIVVHEPKNSSQVKDLQIYFTPFELQTDLCSHIISLVDVAARPKLVQNLCDSGGNCQNYYVAYLTFTQNQGTFGGSAVSDRFVSWVVFDDLNNGYASGFDGLSLELGAGPELEENGGNVAIAARHIYPRYVIQNDPALKPQGHDWWILLFGRADITTKFGTTDANWSGNRNLQCFFYDEDEHVASNTVPIPNELNVVDVDPWVTGLFAGYPHNGFAVCDIQEDGSHTGTGLHNRGTYDNPSLVSNLLPLSTGYYTFVGWSHAKVQGTSVLATWDVIWPIHRTYCSPLMPAGGSAGTTAADTREDCNCKGPGTGSPVNGGGC